MERLTEPQFEKLLVLTSVRKESATREALYRYFVLGYSLREAYEGAGISQSTMSAAVSRLTQTDTSARAYVESLSN